MPMITICSPQGGSGRSSLAVNLANAYARRGNKALLIDFNAQNGLPLHFAMSEAQLPGFVPALEEEVDWSQFIQKVAPNLYLLPYGAATTKQHHAFEALLLRDPQAVNRGLGKLEQFNSLVIIVDLPVGPHPILKQLKDWSDLTLVTLLPDGTAPLHKEKLEAMGAWGLLNQQTQSLFYVLNQVDARYELSHDIEVHFRQTLGERLLGNIHRDSSVSAALSSHKLLREYRPDSAALFDIDAIDKKISTLLGITVGMNNTHQMLPGEM